MTASVTSAGDLPLSSLVSRLPKGEKARESELCYRLELPKAQGILIPAAVSYSAAALPRITDKVAWNVLSTILSLEYLWNEIRVKGGAYVTGASIGALGIPAFYSYRDPSPADELYFRERSYESRCTERERMLALTAVDLLCAVDTLSHGENRCVIGAKEALERCREDDLTIESIR